MKAIVILDEDGHCNVFTQTVESMRLLLDAIVKASKHSTIITDEYIVEATQLVASGSIEDIETFLEECDVTDRRGGGRLYIETINETSAITPEMFF